MCQVPTEHESTRLEKRWSDIARSGPADATAVPRERGDDHSPINALIEAANSAIGIGFRRKQSELNSGNDL